MAKKSKRKQGENPKLDMTPMIDVVFQLLIFFIVTLKQEDILSHLDVTRPAPDPTAKVEDQVKDLLQVEVYARGFTLRGRRVGLAELDRQLTRLGGISQNISVIIKCTGDSPHANLIQLLDVCSKAGLKNLSVFSM